MDDDNRGGAAKRDALQLGSSGEVPEAYSRGWVDFYGREFLVSPEVLIPRPETEMMVDMVLGMAGVAYLPGVRAPEAVISSEARILEVGTGSGCVAVSLALELSRARVMATDLSEGALGVARENARRLGARIEFLRGDLLVGVDRLEECDVVVANLPYVDRGWEWLDMGRLGYEPEMALFAGDGGLELIFRLIREFSRGAREGTYLILEADPCQHGRIVQYASRFGLRYIEVRGFILKFIKTTK